MIKVNNAAFRYDDGDFLFRDLSFDIKAGETLAILGANGIGKTTFLRCMLGFLKLKSGDILVEGKNTKEMSSTEFWKLVSYVPQAKQLVFGYSVLNMVVMGRSQYVSFGRVPSQKDFDIAWNILKDMGLEHLADRSCNKLSGGQLQMVLIARALAKEPKVLILDEPESNLDMKNQLKVLDILDKLAHRQNLSIIINTHFPGNALRCSDKTLMLKSDGYLFGDTAEVINQENIREYFDISAKVIQVQEESGKYHGIIPMNLLGKQEKTAI